MIDCRPTLLKGLEQARATIEQSEVPPIALFAIVVRSDGTFMMTDVSAIKTDVKIDLMQRIKTRFILQSRNEKAEKKAKQK